MARIIMEDIKKDPALASFKMHGLLQTLQDQYRQANTSVCIERAKLVTEYMKSDQARDKPVEIQRAEAIRHYMKNREVIFHDGNLMAGSTTSKKIGAPVYPEVLEG